MEMFVSCRRATVAAPMTYSNTAAALPHGGKMRTIKILAVLLVSAGVVHGAEGEAKTAPAAGGDVKTFRAADIKTVSAATEIGAITVAGADGDVRVEVFMGAPEKCVMTMGVKEGKLILKAEGSKRVKEKSAFGLSSRWADCPAAFKISAPSGVDFEAKSGTGKIGASGITGRVNVKSGTGAVALSALAGRVDVDSGTGEVFGELCAKRLSVKTGTGKVDLKGLCGPADIDSGTGAVTLEWARVPASGSAKVKTGTKDITITLPAGAAVTAALKSGTGKVTSDFKGEGPFRLEAKSGTGDITVLKAK